MNIGFTKRKGDRIALILIAILLVAQLAQVVYAIGVDYSNEGKFIFKPKGILLAFILFVPPFLIAYGGLIFYLIRNKETLPQRPMFFSKNKIAATVFTVIYFFFLIVFLLLSLLIGPEYSSGSNDASFYIVIGGLITLILGLPVDIIGIIIWHKNYGLIKKEPVVSLDANRED